MAEPSVRDSLTIESLLEHIREQSENSPDSALATIREQVQLYQQNGQQKARWELQLEESNIRRFLNQQDSANQLAATVLEQAQRSANRLMTAKAYLQLGINKVQIYKLDEAGDYVLKAQQLVQDDDPVLLRFRIANELAIIYKKLQKFDLALQYYDQIIANYFDELPAYNRYQTLLNKGNVYAMREKYDEAETLYSQASQQLENTSYTRQKALVLYNMGGINYRKQDYAKATSNIKQAMTFYQASGEKAQLERCLRVLGAIDYERGNYEQSIDYYQRALEAAQSTGNIKAIQDNYNNLYLVYADLAKSSRRADYQQLEIDYLTKYYELKDSLYQTETTNKIIELEKKYENEKKNHEIEKLSKENAQQENIILQQKAHSRFLILLSLFISCILLLFIYIYFVNRRKNKLISIQKKRLTNQRNIIASQNKNLQQSLDTQNRIFRIIGHDLRSPLISIFNFSEIIDFMTEEGQTEELKSVSKEISKMAGSVLDLTTNLLNWARTQAGDIRPFIQPVSVKEVVKQHHEIYQQLAEEQKLILDYPQMDEVSVLADQNMLNTIYRNILNNAIKFTPPGGRIAISCTANDGRAEIAIADTGMGMSKQQVQQLFDNNQKQAGKDAQGRKSTGLGLSFCKEFTEAMQGEIRVQSEQNKGTVFRLQLPIASEKPS
ncbi:tetratricopeptide repeat-containing sensor histidine kinase [Mangrovibacterium marinum]|nr:tetratricopeptide repeat-containing sensor histidine kinase [Mangrovibacterium marinum]